MTNRNNSGFAFPTLDLNSGVSPEPYTPSPIVPGAQSLAAVGEAADSFGKRLTQLANNAAQQDAQGHAAADAASGQVTPQDSATVFGQAYNQVAKDSLGAQRRAAAAEQMGQAFIDHGDDPAALKTAFDDIQKGYGSTGFADLDAGLAGDFALHRADYMTRSAEQVRARTVSQAQANFRTTLDHGGALLDQISNGASFDAGGATRVTAAWTSMVTDLAKYGPRGAFDVGPLHFDADATRADALTADELTKTALGAQAGARTSWILGQADRLPDAAAKHAFLADLKTRWDRQDPMLQGLDGAEAQRLFEHLDSEADKTAVDERRGRAEHAQNARDQIQALQWGGDYSRETMLSEAYASGDAGLIGEAHYYAEADTHVRGVLKTVVGRQLGLIPNPGEGPGVEYLDARGNVVGAGGAPGAPRGLRNNNPTNLKTPPGGAWEGQTGVDPQGFAIFASPAAGMAAADRNLVAKQSQHHLATLTAIIGDPTHGWAPAADGNDPVAYAAQVGREVGIDPNAPVDLVHNADLRHRVLTAITRKEVGGSGPAAPVPGVAGQAATSSWTPPPGVIEGTPAFAAWANTREGFSSDPISFARGGTARGPLATVAPLNPAAAFTQDPEQLRNWSAAVRQRAATGAALAHSYGVPARVFTNGEVESIKATLAQNPASVVPLAQAASAALGPAGAASLLREVGQGGEAATALHLGSLAILGRGAIVNAATDGLRLQAEGAKEPPYLSTLKWEDTAAQVGPAFRFAPDVLVAAQNVGRLAHIADSTRGVARSADDYTQAALGMVTGPDGRRFGGVAKVHGSMAVLPPWMAQDGMTDSLRALGDFWATHNTDNRPVYANGQPMSGRDLAGFVPVLRPNGAYWLVNPATNALARTRHGGALEVDFDHAKSFLATAVPDAVLR